MPQRDVRSMERLIDELADLRADLLGLERSGWRSVAASSSGLS